MSGVEQGDRVQLHYQAVIDGQVFAASQGNPIEITAGGQDAIPGLCAAVIGMKTGERRRLQLSPCQSFGNAGTAVERVVPHDRIPPGAMVGDTLRISLAGMCIQLWIIGVGDDGFRVSSQHPMAGKTLEIEFAVGLVSRDPQ